MNLDIPTDSNVLIPPSPTGSRRSLLTPLPTPGHFLLVLDNTALEKIKRCPVMAENYLVHGREPHARNAALTYGGAIHAGLEATLRGASYQDACIAIQNFFADNPSPPDEWRTPNVAMEVLGHYREWAQLPGNQWEILEDENGPLIERAFELPLGVLEVNAELDFLKSGDRPAPSTYFVYQIHLAWSGRIDLIARFPNGSIRVVDHKTSSISGTYAEQDFIQSFQLASQTMGYVWAARRLYPQIPVNGFALNCLRLKKPTGSGNLTFPGPRGGDPVLKFFRNFYSYSDDRLAEWVDDTLATIEDFVHCLVRSKFPHNDKQCFDKYGKCPYHDVCVEDNPRIRSNMLHSDMFKPVTWNPTEGR